MTDDTQGLEERQTVAVEKTARNVDTLVTIAQCWTAVAVLGAIVWLIFAVRS